MRQSLPEDLPNLTGSPSDIIKALGIEYITFSYDNVFKVSSLNTNDVTAVNANISLWDLIEKKEKNTYRYHGYPLHHFLPFEDRYNTKIRIGYLSENGLCYESMVSLNDPEIVTKQVSENRGYRTVECTKAEKVIIKGMKTTKWKACKKLYTPCTSRYSNGEIWFIHTKDELMSRLSKTHPYALEYLYDKDEPRDKVWFDMRVIAQAPWFETLKKAGYQFVDKFSANAYTTTIDMSTLNTICKAGTSPDTIFKIPRVIYKQLRGKDVNMANIRDIVSLNETCELTAEDINDMLSVDSRVKPYYLGDIKNTLDQVNEGQEKPLFTYRSLMKYLERLDMYEAIDDTGMALMTIRDYVETCRQLHITPRFDTDSLKREHDVAARNLRVYLQEQRDKREQEIKDKQDIAYGKAEDAMEAAYLVSSIYNYSEQVFSIKAIQNMDELLDEANQQSNCVASYANSIKSGSTMIFSMRETEHPEKSLITVQLDPFSLKIVQAYLSHNRSIKSQAQKAFLKRWLDYVKSIDIVKCA